MCLFCCSVDVLLVLIAIVFPPFPVWVKRGICSADSLINIALCMLGFFPGLLHSWYIISRYPEEPFLDPADLEAQGIRPTGPATTVYTVRRFVYSPIPQSERAPLPAASVPAQSSSPAPASAPAPAADVMPATRYTDDPLAGPSESYGVPPAYEEVAGASSSSASDIKDNKIQRGE
ncbi:uncharacterized protein V1516DRAFT_153409 [Lipomyces oligophaga]|uniref:uncharacterized protein n=1 Tax=Lipomyces oligophaga TaxID=45792 RepID=UPI0034CDFE6B